jgi:hemolysin type calcium-binding protein
VGALAALGLAALPSATLGATVDVSGGILTYQAGSAETNDVTIQRSPSVYDINDLGLFTPIGVSGGCFSGGTGTATCPSGSAVASIVVSLDDGNDRSTILSIDPARTDPATIHGGTGLDDLRGSGVDDSLFGDDGNDTLDGAGGSDVLSGGPGIDTATYQFRANTVTVSLDGVANDGEGSGELDNVLGDVENVVGGDGADILSGDKGPNKLSGGLDNDKLDGGAGSDVLDGGQGDDTISARDGTRDSVACGPGNDVAVVDAVDDVASDCEVVDRPAGPPPTQPADPPATVITPLTPLISLVSSRVPTLTANRKGVVPVKLRCSRSTTTAKRCRGIIALEMTIHPPAARYRPERRRASDARHKRRRLNLRLARRRFAVPAGRTQKVPLHLIASARRRLNSCRRLRVRIVVSSRDAHGHTRKVTRKAILRSARGARRPARRYVCS